MIHPFLEVGGLLFWVITAVVFLVAVSEIQSEKVLATSLTILGYIAAIVLLTNGGDLGMAFLKAHPWYILYGFGAYIAGAIIWTPIKWRVFFLPNLFEKYEELRVDFLEENGLKAMPADQTTRDKFAQYASRSGMNLNSQRMVRNNKARIMAWLGYWPISLIGTFLGDFLTRVAKTIYAALAGFLQGQSDRMASKYSELE